MVPIFLIILVISQLLCFYFIILLNMKVSKFNNLEKRQDQLLREMDDAISLYLIEMKEENDRLIKELSIVKPTEQNNVKLEDKEKVNFATGLQEKNALDTIGNNPHDVTIKDTKSFIPLSKVQSAYNQPAVKAKSSNETSNNMEQLMEEEPFVAPSDEEKILSLHQKGRSIDEIAKIMEKGKTEIELLLKFHG